MAHGGLDAKHPGHFSETFRQVQTEGEITDENLTDMEPKDKSALHKEVTEIAYKEYT